MVDDGQGFFQRIRPNAEWDVVRTILFVLLSQMLPGIYALLDSSPSLKVGALLSALGLIGAIGLAVPRIPPVKAEEWEEQADRFRSLVEIEGDYRLFLTGNLVEWTLDRGSGSGFEGRPIQAFIEESIRASALLRRAVRYKAKHDERTSGDAVWLNAIMECVSFDYPKSRGVEDGVRVEHGHVDALCSKSAHLCVRLQYEPGLVSQLRASAKKRGTMEK